LKAEIIKYLDAIGIKKLIQERIEEIYEFYSRICPEDIEDIFINEYIKEDGTRVYDALRFYSKNFTMLATDFLHMDTFFFAANMAEKPLSIMIEKKDYDFKKANVKSRMNVKIYWTITPVPSILKASKENCDYLKTLIEKRYLYLVCGNTSQTQGT